ncbi:MAG TPA: hypothetical protein VH325_01825 [Bryobacteraceae bacterium]|nr:hypothetical protein [Bryobacteraceae bacterium]
MNCDEAQSHVSAIYDGEQAPEDAAQHVESCPICRERLRLYAQIGAETRLLASRIPATTFVPHELLEKVRSKRRGRLDFFTTRVRVPRFALIVLALILLTALPAGWTFLRAQNRPLWFQFELEPGDSTERPPTYVAQPGYKNRMGWMFTRSGSTASSLPSLFGARITVGAVEPNGVQVDIKAHNFGTGHFFPGQRLEELAKIPEQTFHYVPGKALQIPVDGGGTLILRGSVVDHRPKIAWGHPLEPDPGELILSSPILIQGKRVLFDMAGATTSVYRDAEAARLNSPGEGLFIIGLRQFPGAVKAKANWGRLTFELNSKQYTLVAGSPICGGDQPHDVWVGLNKDFAGPNGDKEFLGSGPNPVNK